MQRVSLPGVFVAAALWIAAAACGAPPSEALVLENGALTVHNHTDQEWRDVEIWLNRQFRVTVPAIPPRVGRFQVHVNSFTAGFGQRFEFNRMQVTDLRLTAKGADGQPIELVKQFQKSGLAGALGGKQ